MLPQTRPITPSSTSAIANVSSTDDDMCAPRIRRTVARYSIHPKANITGVVMRIVSSGSSSIDVQIE